MNNEPKGPLHVILGSGGAVANSLAAALLAQGHRVRLVSRKGRTLPGCESFAADMTDPLFAHQATEGAHTAYLTVGLSYDIAVWKDSWPVIMRMTIAACQASGTRLMFFDNVYPYGPVEGPMTEQTPYNPTSKKGEIRALIASRLEDSGLNYLIARSADFYGPGSEAVSVASMTVFSRLAQGKGPQWLGRADMPHSFSYVPDLGPAMVLLQTRESAWGQTWHLPTAAPALTGAEFCAQAAAAFGSDKAKPQTMAKWLAWLMGLASPMMREIPEMMYQNDRPYLFDSTKFERAFSSYPTPYAIGIKATAEAAQALVR